MVRRTKVLRRDENVTQHVCVFLNPQKFSCVRRVRIFFCLFEQVYERCQTCTLTQSNAGTGHLEIWSFASRRFDRVARVDPFSKPHIAVCTVQLYWDTKTKLLYVANDDGSTCCVRFVESWWTRVNRGRFKEESTVSSDVMDIIWKCSNAHATMISGMVPILSNHLMTSSYDRTVKLWDARTGTYVATLRQGMSDDGTYFSPSFVTLRTQTQLLYLLHSIIAHEH